MKLLRARLEGGTIDEYARAAIQGRTSFEYREVFAAVDGVQCRSRVLFVFPDVPGDDTLIFIPHTAGDWVEPVVSASFAIAESFKTDVSRN